jgi:hypothetical protein
LALIVNIGRLGFPAWVDREVRLGLVRNTRDPRFRIIPVLTDGADLVALSPFLQQHQCVDPGDAWRAAVAIRRWLESL